MFVVYILENNEGKLYIGQTDNIHRRLNEHNDPNAPKSKFTAKHAPWKIVWSEEHPDRNSAVRREKQIKSMRSARWIRDNLL